ncbi:TetR/AcrR family transcriptional regulator [Serratia ureilytica]
MAPGAPFTVSGAADGKPRKIVEAALHVLPRGFHQTSMRDIAQAAGVSVGNLYNHLPARKR